MIQKPIQSQETTSIIPQARQLFTVKDISIITGWSPQTIRNRICNTSGNPFPIHPVRIGGSVRFRKKDVEAFLESI